VTLLASRVDALAQRLDKVGTNPISGSSSKSPMRVYAFCETCGVQCHTSIECYNVFSTIKHANTQHSFNPSPQNTFYSTTYNQGWKSHLNSPYKNPNPHRQSSWQLPSFQYRAPYNPPYPPPQSKSNFESLMERFITTQTKTNEALGESINQLTSKFDVMASHQKAMDI